MRWLPKLFALLAAGMLSVLAVYLVIRRLYQRYGNRYYDHSDWQADDDYMGGMH